MKLLAVVFYSNFSLRCGIFFSFNNDLHWK